jgi:ABC-2 type transport system permease protein
MSLRRIFGVYLRYLYVVRKGLHQLCDLLYWPLVDILLWGLASVWMQKGQADVHNFPLILMTALIFWQVAWRGSVDISVSLLQEFWQRNLVNLFSTPLKFSEWIAGILLLCFSKLFVTVFFGSIMVYLLYTLNVFTIGWTFLPFAIALLLFGWTMGFIAAGLIIYWGHKVEMLAWMTPYLFAPFSAVFYPVEVLPGWAHKVAYCLPTTYIFEGMRSILKTGHFPLHHFWISIGLNLLFLSAALFFFRKMFLKSLAKGLARHE